MCSIHILGHIKEIFSTNKEYAQDMKLHIFSILQNMAVPQWPIVFMDNENFRRGNVLWACIGNIFNEKMNLKVAIFAENEF